MILNKHCTIKSLSIKLATEPALERSLVDQFEPMATLAAS